MKIKPNVAMAYVFAFVVIVAAAFFSTIQPKKETETVSNAVNVGQSANVIDQTSVDNAIATNIAANVAQVSNLPVANSVSSLAVSVQSKSEFMQENNTATTKPQIIDVVSSNRFVISYTTVEGDDVNSLANKFNISANTIKWNNNLTSDTLSAGKTLKILPINGVLYSVKSGDTIDSIAKKYNVDSTRLILYNDLDVSGLSVGSEIILPSGTLPETERPGYVAPVTYYFYSGFAGASSGKTWYISTGTGPCPAYTFGNCTCYAFNRRVQLGLPVGGHGGIPQWGHAATWAYYAGLPANRGGGGLTVNNTPSVGSIIQNGGGYGHVGIVESLLSNGDISISEMNASFSGGGYNIVSGRIIPASSVSQYMYIH